MDARARGAISRSRSRGRVDSRRVQLLVFTVVGLSAMVVAYAFGLGGAVGFLIFLAILFVGVCGSRAAVGAVPSI